MIIDKAQYVNFLIHQDYDSWSFEDIKFVYPDLNSTLIELERENTNMDLIKKCKKLNILLAGKLSQFLGFK